MKVDAFNIYLHKKDKLNNQYNKNKIKSSIKKNKH